MLGLSGCGVHLEEDAPAIPLIPKRTPIGGESALLTLLHTTQELADALRSGEGGRRAHAFADVHTHQAAVLDSALRRKGVPADLLAPPTSATGGGAVLDRERAALALVHDLYAAAPLDLLPTLASLAAARTVVCRALTSDGTSAGSSSGSGTSSPTDPASAIGTEASGSGTATSDIGTGSASAQTPAEPGLAGLPALASPAAALPYLAASRAAVYGLEVVAARTHKDLRTAAATTLESVRGLALAQESAAGADAPPAPTAYRLPLNADDEESGRRLAEYLAGRLVDAYAAALTTTTDAGTHASTEQIAAARTGVAVGAAWLADAALLADDWGLALAPFPGLT